jgi:hypothetical protein
VVLEIEFSREDCSIKSQSNKFGRDIQTNRCTNHKLEIQEILIGKAI